MERSNGGIAFGAVLILLGLFFLGEVAGWWAYDWYSITTIWPLILVAIGLRLILPRGLSYDLVILVAVLAIIATQALVPPKPVSQTGFFGFHWHKSNTSTSSNSSITGPTISNANQLRLSTNAAAGTFTLKDLDTRSSYLYTASVSHGNLQQTDSRNNDAAIAELDPEHGVFFGLPEFKYDLAVTPKVPVELDIDAGASKADFDLSNLQLTKLKLNAGATSSTIHLGAKSAHQKLTLELGASSLNLDAPKDAGLKITFDSGLSTNNFEDAGLGQSDDNYTTPNYEQAGTQIEIDISGGASTIKLNRS